MSLVSPSHRPDCRVSQVVPAHWEQLLDERDRRQLAELRALGADLNWRTRELPSLDSRVIHHHTVVALGPDLERLLGVTGPVDFHYHDRDVMIRRPVRSAIGQARAALLVH